MKKGNWYPHARARWAEGTYPQYNYGPPTWMKFVTIGAVYLVDVLGIPVPTTITQFDMSDSKYSYVPSRGAVIYRGDFDNGIVAGFWSFLVGIDNEFGCYARLAMQINDGLANPMVIYDSQGITQTGEWFRDSPRDFNVTNRLPGVTPWAFVALVTVRPLTYAELRALSENPDNTAPIIWNDTGEP